MTTFLSHPQRKQIRSSIQQFSDAKAILEQALRTQQPAPSSLIRKLNRVTGTTDPEAQLRAVEAVHAEMELQYHATLREMAPNDLAAFCEYMDPDEPPADWHVWLCDKLERMERREEGFLRLGVSAPPGHAKSTYSSRKFSAWYMGRNARHRYIQAGHTQGFCENEFGKKTKAIIDSDRYRDVFPTVGLASDAKAAGYWALAGTGGSYLTRGVGQGIAGFRAHCAGVDDPFATREDAESQTIRDKVFDWFSADFTTRLLPRAPLFIVATRWHSDDLLGRVEEMAREGKGLPWYIINLPAIAVDEDDPLGRSPGDPLWPEFYTHDHLLNLQATLPARDWNSLYQGRPVDEEGGVVKGAWFKRYDRLPDEDDIIRKTLSVDSASKTGERNDYTAIGVWYEDINHNHYLAHVERKRMEIPELCVRVPAMASTWGCGTVLVEDKGSGTQLLQIVGPKSAIPMVPISVNNNSKEFRFDGVAPMFETGKVWLPKNSVWLPAYEAELLGFPTAKYDDQVDMTSQYLTWARVLAGRGTRKLQGHGKDRSKIGSDKARENIERHLAALNEATKNDPIRLALEAARDRAP